MLVSFSVALPIGTKFNNQFLEKINCNNKICTYNIKSHFGEREFEYQINATVRHEAAHAAQFCKGGNYHLGVDREKFAGYPNERVYGPLSIYKDHTHNQKVMELEAFALESEPYFVFRNLERFCF